MKAIGLILIIVGAVMLIWTGFSFTKKEKVIDAGPIQVSKDKKESVNWPPYAGGIMVVAGAIVLAAGRKKS